MTSVRLTKGIKEDIVTGILRDTPKGNFREKAEKALITYVVSTLPDFVRSMRDNKSMIKFLTSTYVHIYLHPGTSSRSIYVSVTGLPGGHGITSGNIPPALLDELRSLDEQQSDEEATRIKLKNKLTGILSRYTTSAKLLADYPDFEKYVPIPDEPAMPIAVNTRVLDELELLGWDPKLKNGRKL